MNTTLKLSFEVDNMLANLALTQANIAFCADVNANAGQLVVPPTTTPNRHAHRHHAHRHAAA